MTHFVLVYGSLKLPYWNNVYLQDQTFVSFGSTDPIFKMYDGAYPAISLSNDGAPVFGEVYEVDDDGLRDLDRLEGHPTYYERQLKSVLLETGEKILAWVYIMDEAGRYFDEEIEPNIDGFLIWEKNHGR